MNEFFKTIEDHDAAALVTGFFILLVLRIIFIRKK